MNANITKRNELLAQKVIKGLQSRNMAGYYAADKEAALKQALALIPEGSTVTMGGGMSVHEIGLVKARILVNIDGNSNRVSALAQGPRKVIVIAGMNKICDDVDGAMKRARNVAAPINAQRFGLNTPCAKTGACMNCKSPDTICCQFLITRFSRHPGRIHVILVNDNLGF